MAISTSIAPVDLYHQTYGEDGPPLIILHGLLGSSDNWHTLSRTVFSERFRVFAVDQRNHGRSPHADRFDYPSMVADLEAFLEQQGLESTHLLGHSMGGKTAMHAALEMPERVDRLVVADMAPKAYPSHHEVLFDALRSLDPKQYDRRREIDADLADVIKSRRIRQFLLKNLTHNGEHYTWKPNLDAIHAHYNEVLKGIQSDHTFDGPALFVRGAQSDYVADDDWPRIQRNFPQADLATIDDAEHWVHADAPTEFAEVVMDFLS